jgi:hypothetical protein
MQVTFYGERVIANALHMQIWFKIVKSTHTHTHIHQINVNHEIIRESKLSIITFLHNYHFIFRSLMVNYLLE